MRKVRGIPILIGTNWIFRKKGLSRPEKGVCVVKGKHVPAWLGLLASCVLALCGPAAASGPFTVHASVTGGEGIAQAQTVQADFTAPAGQSAVAVRFRKDSPKEGTHTEKLGRNIFSVDRNGYMMDGSGNPLYQLPPGRYRFIVAGSPGTTGTLVYNLVP